MIVARRILSAAVRLPAARRFSMARRREPVKNPVTVSFLTLNH
jgi:hypothetical protein